MLELDGGCSSRSDGRWTLDAGRWTPDAGRWTLDAGRWTLDAARWAALVWLQASGVKLQACFTPDLFHAPGVRLTQTCRPEGPPTRSRKPLGFKLL